MSPSRAFDFGGEVAIVTGGGCLVKNELGNGSATAVLLARHGARVAVVDRDAQAAAETKRIIEEEGGVAEVVQADVTLDTDCLAAVSKVIELFGRVDILVNIVGTGYPTGKAEAVTTEAFNEGMHYNVTSMVQMVRHTVPAMRASGKGAIVNMSSVVGLTGGAPGVFYSTSKGAIVSMTRAMAGHYGPDAIRVNCVCPGMAYTPMARTNAGDDGAMTEQMRAERKNLGFLKYEGTAMDIGYGSFSDAFCLLPLVASDAVTKWGRYVRLTRADGPTFSHPLSGQQGGTVDHRRDSAHRRRGRIVSSHVPSHRPRYGHLHGTNLLTPHVAPPTVYSWQGRSPQDGLHGEGQGRDARSQVLVAKPRAYFLRRRLVAMQRAFIHQRQPALGILGVRLCATGRIVVEYHIGSRPIKVTRMCYIGLFRKWNFAWHKISTPMYTPM
ncbi:hypothetical protein RB595_006005 [Gaeumannomyces hyphopodioides]